MRIASHRSLGEADRDINVRVPSSRSAARTSGVGLDACLRLASPSLRSTPNRKDRS